MKILIGGQKGGSGKTTFAVNLAAYFANKGVDVMLVDTDNKQTSSMKWALRRSKLSDVPKVNCVLALDDVRPTVNDLNSRYELIIIDAGGRDSMEFRTSLLVCDVCVMPLIPSSFDEDTMPYVNSIVTDSKIYNEGLKVYAMSSKCPQNKRAREKRTEDLVEELEEFENILLSPHHIVYRVAYLDSASSGKGVTELKDPLAAQEIINLAQDLYPL